MPKILIFDCKQEISSFNPLTSGYENFHILTGEQLFRHRGLNTEFGGALAVFDKREDVTVLPTIFAQAGSAGILSAAGWKKLSEQVLASIAEKIDEADAIYACLHGAMGAEGELDPEGYLLQE